MLPPAEQPPRPSFARLLADLDGKKPEPASPLIFWRRPPASGGADLFTAFTVPAHRDGNGTPKGSVLPESWRGALAGKIVLIGGGFRDRDLHLTPLTVASREPIHGVGIHAQILAQLRDGRSIHEMPWWVEFLIAAAVAGLGVYAARPLADAERERRDLDRGCVPGNRNRRQPAVLANPYRSAIRNAVPGLGSRAVCRQLVRVPGRKGSRAI